MLATDATGELLHRLARPYDAVAAVSAVLGLPTGASKQLVGAVVATCDEAEDLLDAFPRTVRSLAVSMSTKPERLRGEIRGPVLWGETIGARSASAGDPGLFVCARPDRAYDTYENQVLVAALKSVRNAARAVESVPSGDYDDDVLRRARHNGHRATVALDHQALVGVSARLDGRALRRTRSGHRRRVYGPAVAMLDRAAEPLSVDHLSLFVDRRTGQLHGELIEALDTAEESAGQPLRLRVRDHELEAGPVRFRHPSLPTEGRPTGVTVSST